MTYAFIANMDMLFWDNKMFCFFFMQIHQLGLELQNKYNAALGVGV